MLVWCCKPSALEAQVIYPPQKRSHPGFVALKQQKSRRSALPSQPGQEAAKPNRACSYVLRAEETPWKNRWQKHQLHATAVRIWAVKIPSFHNSAKAPHYPPITLSLLLFHSHPRAPICQQTFALTSAMPCYSQTRQQDRLQVPSPSQPSCICAGEDRDRAVNSEAAPTPPDPGPTRLQNCPPTSRHTRKRAGGCMNSRV